MANPESLAALAARVVQKLVARDLQIATAESCTGGWIAKALTDVAGSSACLGYGFVSYSNDAKESLLGVKHQTLLEQGAVSDAVVREMAAGAARVSQADVAVAVSGIAGPGGGTDDKPVGSVWIAWQVSGVADATLYRFVGDRDAVRLQTVGAALHGVLERIDRNEPGV